MPEDTYDGSTATRSLSPARPPSPPPHRCEPAPTSVPAATGLSYVVGVSGASGASYAVRLVELLLLGGHTVHLVVSTYGKQLLFDELGIRLITLGAICPHLAAAGTAAETRGPSFEDRLVIHPNQNVGAVIASGSFLHEGMAVLPCSSASLGAIATGAGSNLLTRAAMVTLKERRPLVVCHREMPLSLIDIENMRALSLAGAHLCSPNPGFYLHPRSLADVIDFVVGKVLDLLAVPHDLKTRYGKH